MFPFGVTPYSTFTPLGTDFNVYGSGATPTGASSMPMSFGTTQLGTGLTNGFQLPSFGISSLGSSKPGFMDDFANMSGMDALKLGFGGLSTLGNLYGGLKSLDLANKQFDFTKATTERNMANSINSYNTALTDRITSRAKAQGMSDQEVQSYLSKNSMK